MKISNLTKRSSLLSHVFILISIFFVFTISKVDASIIDNVIGLFTKENKGETVERSSDDSSFLLRSNISNLFLDSNSFKNKDYILNIDEDVKINNDGALVVQSGPMRVSTEEEKPVDDTISVYEIKQGDTIETVAKLFNISKNTIIWANNLKTTKLIPGNTLLIFPITGIQYTAKSKISLANIAKKYRADLEEIATYNGLPADTMIAKGESVFIPDAEGEIQVESKSNKTKVVTPKYKNNVVAGYFMKPVSGCARTQGLHGPYGTAIDFGCRVGTGIAASADGVVIRSDSTGYNGGYGQVVIIAHPNGVQTIYSHLSRIDVSVGQKVSQGQVIGATGNTGRSTGPHLHFETRGTRNPF